MKRRICKGGVDNYPLWWYGQSNRLQNFGDRTNFLTPHGAVFQENGYYFNSANADYLEDIYGRHLISDGTNGLWSQLYLTDSAVLPCGSIIGTGDRLYLTTDVIPYITGKVVLYPEFCPNLKHFKCRVNKVSVFDVSRILLLTYLNCYNNNISVLDVSKLINIETLICSNNLITTLDVLNLINLASLSCHDLLLSNLDVSNNSKITELLCNNNLMDQAAVDKVLCDANAWNTSGGTLDISGNTAPSSTGTDCKNDMVNNRGWTVTTD